MAAIDVIAVLSQLLSDGTLRDAFAADPSGTVAQYDLTENDRRAIRQLSPQDLEVQARILLGKRWDAVRRCLPSTCGRLATEGRELFQQSARKRPRLLADHDLADTIAFCDFLAVMRPLDLDPAERNRVKFLHSNSWITIRPVRSRRGHGSCRRLQLLIRLSRRRWHEFQFGV